MREFLKRFAPYIKGYGREFRIAILGGLCTAVCTSYSAYLIKPALDDVFIKQDLQMLNILPFLVIGAYLGKGIGIYVQAYYMNYIGQDIVRRMREKLFSHILTFEMDFFNKIRNGELLSRVTGDIDAIRSAVSNYIADFAREGVTIIGLICVVIYQSPKLAFFGLIIIPGTLFLINMMAKRIKKFSKELIGGSADITSKLTEIFNNCELIKASNSESFEAREFIQLNMYLFKVSIKAAKFNQMIVPFMEISASLMIAIIIYLGGQEVIDGNMTTGEFFSFVAAMFMVYTPLKRLTSSYTGMQSAIVAGNRIFEMLNREAKIVDGKIVLKDRIESVVFDNVGLTYDDKVALKNINLDFNLNEIIAIRGKSGSGKSSLINLLLRLYEPTSGKVLINGISSSDYTQASIRDSMAIVTQRIFIFNDTIANNVAYGNDYSEEKVIDALKKSLAWEFVARLPEGIHTKLDEAGVNLSGGQRQRISIARAIYRDPQILIFDEATSALDENTENLIKQTIELIKKDKIIIMITHRPSTLSIATKIIDIYDGEVTKVVTRAM